MSVYKRLEALKISLPEVEPPAAAFVPVVRTGNLVFVSGHIARKDGKPWTGKLGENLSTPQGKEAARGIAVGQELLALERASGFDHPGQFRARHAVRFRGHAPGRLRSRGIEARRRSVGADHCVPR